MFPPDKGTYVLILQLDTSAHLTIGKLGSFDFPAGWYAYVGSAFGPGGLRGRLKHHLSPVTKLHWHIDYLRTVANVREVWWATDDTRYEHQWAAALQKSLDAIIPAPRFGASDCKCATHLVYFPEKLEFDSFRVSAEMQLHREKTDYSW
jgi:Uri superfamily endonuclease